MIGEVVIILVLDCDMCMEEVAATGTTVREARRYGRSIGWVFTGGRDICARCVEREVATSDAAG